MPYGTMSAVELSLTSIMDKVYVDDWGQCQARPLRRAARPRRRRAWSPSESIAGELADVVAGTRPGREARRRAHPVLAPRPRDDRHRARPGDPRARGRAGRRHAAALPMIVLERADQLDLGPYRRIVAEHEPVAHRPRARSRRSDAARARLLAHLDGGARAYGVNTGVGYLAAHPHRAGGPAGVPARAARCAARGTGRRSRRRSCAARCCSGSRASSSGAAGVSRGAVRLPRRAAQRRLVAARALARDLERGRGHRAEPPVPDARRSGGVLEDGAAVPAAEALARRGVRALRARASRRASRSSTARRSHPALARPAGRARARAARARDARGRADRRGRGRLAAAVLAADRRAQGRSRAGCAIHAAAGRARMPAREDWSDRPQAPVSFRVLPQVHGAALDLARRTPSAQVERELRAVTDSPLFLPADGDEPAGLYPSGNFHAAGARPRSSTRWRSPSPRSATSPRSGLHRLLDQRFSRPARPARRTSPAGRRAWSSSTRR